MATEATAGPNSRRHRPDGLDPDEDGGPPLALPWTLVVEVEDWSADLEHGAPLPRAGDRIEYIVEDGTRRHFRVREIVHTVQSSASERPSVREEDRGPNATVSGDHSAHAPSTLRAGIPRVVVDPEEH